MNAALAFLERVQGLLQRLGQTQTEAISHAGALVADALLAGHHIYLSPTSHSIHTEVTHRAGGFMDPQILSPGATELAAGDVVIIGTNAGYDVTTVGLAQRCRALGVGTVAITTVAYEQAIRSADPSGKLLHEVADVTIDQGGVAGDAILDFAAIDVPVIPASGVPAVAAVWMVFAEAADRMVAAGKPPLVYQSIQLPGAVERNARYLAEAQRSGLGYVLPPSLSEG